MSKAHLFDRKKGFASCINRLSDKILLVTCNRATFLKIYKRAPLKCCVKCLEKNFKKGVN